MSDLRRELARALNGASAESGSNTPDFILAEYLAACLAAFDAATKAREGWYGHGHQPGVIPGNKIEVPAADLSAPRGETPRRPTVVTLCGSTRFYEQFQRANYEETMAGRIVLSVGFFVHAAGQAHGEGVGATSEQKVALDELHKRKIDLSDEILVLNVGGYVGSSTRGEIEYAAATGKRIRWLEPETAFTFGGGTGKRGETGGEDRRG